MPRSRDLAIFVLTTDRLTDKPIALPIAAYMRRVNIVNDTASELRTPLLYRRPSTVPNVWPKKHVLI